MIQKYAYNARILFEKITQVVLDIYIIMLTLVSLLSISQIHVIQI